MKQQFIALAVVLIAGCSETGAEKAPIKTTYAEIQREFSENGVAAREKYSRQAAELTDTVNSITSTGLVFMVSDQKTPYAVLIESKSIPELAGLKAGDKLTVRCSRVDELQIGQCKVIR